MSNVCVKGMLATGCLINTLSFTGDSESIANDLIVLALLNKSSLLNNIIFLVTSDSS